MKPYQALIWNEWRQMRGSVIALAGVTILLWLLLLAGYFYRIKAEYIESAAAVLIIGLPILYSIVLADSFAREFSQKTDSFLLEMPVSPTKIFFCKYLANLIVFLILTVITTLIMTLIMSYAIDSKTGRDSIEIKPLLLLVISCWAPVHAMVFMTSLLGKKPGNGIPAIMFMPLLYVLLLPGTMAITVFFIKNDSTWTTSSLLLALIILYCFCIGFGWYLWSRRIACGRKIMKPVIAASTIMLITPLILFAMVYLYASHSYNSAINAAVAAGLEVDYSKLSRPEPVPAEQNADAGISDFNNEYNPTQKGSSRRESRKKMTGLFPSQCLTGSSWTETDFNFSGKRHEVLQQKIMIETADFILNNSHMNKCHTILAEALKKPYCRVVNSSRYLYFTAGVFLSDRAYALRISRRENENDFFECIAGIDKIANALTEQPYSLTKEIGLKLKEVEYQTAIAAGPDTFGSIKFYNQMIHDIALVNPALSAKAYEYDYLRTLATGWFTPRNIIKKSDWEVWFFFLPKEFTGATTGIRWEIQRHKLLKQASTSTSIKTIESEIISLEKAQNKVPDKFHIRSDIREYFAWRSKFESYKLCLALKIYHIKYGRFPDSLQQLVPEILPKIPVNPKTGKDYIYQPETDGFLLFGNTNRVDYGIKYQTWKINEERAK